MRTAIHLEREKATAEGRTAPNADALLAIAEELLPKLRAAEWRDRAEAAAKIADEISLRDLRSVVTGADVARDDEGRQLAASLREALERRVEALRQEWVGEVTQNLEEGRVVRALRLAARPPSRRPASRRSWRPSWPRRRAGPWPRTRLPTAGLPSSKRWPPPRCAVRSNPQACRPTRPRTSCRRPVSPPAASPPSPPCSASPCRHRRGRCAPPAVPGRGSHPAGEATRPSRAAPGHDRPPAGPRDAAGRHRRRSHPPADPAEPAADPTPAAADAPPATEAATTVEATPPAGPAEPAADPTPRRRRATGNRGGHRCRTHPACGPATAADPAPPPPRTTATEPATAGTHAAGRRGGARARRRSRPHRPGRPNGLGRVVGNVGT